MMRILVVEDEWKVASFIARASKENSFAVDMVETGEKALVLSRNVRHDAMVLDVKLPGISGIDVCRELRRLGNLVPVMMLTAQTLVEQSVEGLNAGADDYSVKPFVLSEFLAPGPSARRRRRNRLRVKRHLVR
jgi:two-component system copper resistance phosphate regulon response regulator CusR